jgi:hypothetical protein
MGNAEGEIEFFQCPKGFLAEPGFIPEFKGVSKPFGSWEGREENAEFLKSLFLKFESGRKLPEDYSQFLLQRRSMVKKKGEGFPAILQPFDMGDEPASLDGKIEILGGPFIPTLKDLFLGQAIKRDIQLDRVEMFSIEFEPLSLGKIRRVENTIPPMGVIVAAGTN